jgi:hypothetical protein
MLFNPNRQKFLALGARKKAIARRKIIRCTDTRTMRPMLLTFEIFGGTWGAKVSYCPAPPFRGVPRKLPYNEAIGRSLPGIGCLSRYGKTTSPVQLHAVIR